MSLKREENKCADSASGSALSDDNNGAIYSEGGSVNDDNIMQLNVDTIQGLKIYDNLFGINAIDNWSTPNWPLPQIPGHHSSSPTNVDSNLGMLNDEKDAKDDLPTQNIFKTVDQQGSSLQFSMEQLQIKTQLQHQQQELPLLSAALDEQNKPNVLLSDQQAADMHNSLTRLWSKYHSQVKIFNYQEDQVD